MTISLIEQAQFLSADVCHEIIVIAEKQGWQKAGLLGEQRDGYRIGDSLWLTQGAPVLTELKKCVAKATGTAVENQEAVHITRYSVGGEYKPHMDYFHKGESYYEIVTRRGGQRIKTALIYLNDDFDGGETFFPKLKITIQPETGKLVAWDNVNSDGEPNPDTLHAGLPVEKGTKYLLSVWIREKPLATLPQPVQEPKILQIESFLGPDECRTFAKLYDMYAGKVSGRDYNGRPVVSYQDIKSGQLNGVIQKTKMKLEHGPRLSLESAFLSCLFPGDRHIPHADNEKLNDGKWIPNHTPRRDYSAMLYLNDDFTGGELIFPQQKITIKPRAGLLVVFPSNHQFVHEVRPVISGRRYSLPIWFTLHPSTQQSHPHSEQSQFIVQVPFKSRAEADALISAHPHARLGFAPQGAGTELKKILSKIGLEPAPGCKCNQHIQEMNIRGPAWCRENIETIVGWLAVEAQRAKLPFIATGAKVLIKRAIRKAEKGLHGPILKQ